MDKINSTLSKALIEKKLIDEETLEPFTREAREFGRSLSSILVGNGITFFHKF